MTEVWRGERADEHGGRVAAAAAVHGCEVSDLLDLSSTLNHFAPDIVPIVSRSAGHAVHYPDPARATDALAEALGADPGRVILTNGAAEGIAILAALYPAGDVRDPDFSLYRRHLAEVRQGAPRWRSNPSSPFGELAADDAEAEIWDESHYALATGRWTRGDDESWRVTSLTKVWRCAGLRLGYVIAPTDHHAARFRAQQPEWAVNGIALAAVEPMLDRTDLAELHRTLTVHRGLLVEALRERGLAARDTDASWILVDAAGHLVEPLFEQRILVRELGNYGLPGSLRVAVPNEAGLERLTSALDRVA